MCDDKTSLLSVVFLSSTLQFFVTDSIVKAYYSCFTAYFSFYFNEKYRSCFFVVLISLHMDNINWFISLNFLAEIMLISGTHVGSRVWRDSHDDCSRGIAVVCPIWTWTLQESSTCLQPAAEGAPACIRALVIRWCCWLGGVPAGSQPAGERRGEVDIYV